MKYFLPYFHQLRTTEKEDEQCGRKRGHMEQDDTSLLLSLDATAAILAAAILHPSSSLLVSFLNR